MNARSPLVSTEWLAERLEAPDIRVADASWYLPQEQRDVRAEYRSAHIPRAVFFDLDELSDEGSSLPHMLPPAVKFASRMRRLGLGDGNTVVVYDSAGIYSAPRAWWMLRAMGHEEVFVLDGGLPKWKREGRPIEDLSAQPFARHFTPRPNNALIRDYRQVAQALKSRSAQIVDARSAKRFRGEEKEPRPGVRAGHMPGALNLPYTELTTAEGVLKQPTELRALFSAREIDLERPQITTCGSGITAASLMLAMVVAGAPSVALYDGSWADWGGREDAAVERS
ncbi:MAG: 3-mercaptopyruvate sulfurtransferase [Alphaproteobacteria bacterium]|nr:3-mercaptopyruvate sulfurtransferase [Alphaproteobacteria bacterium]